MEQRNDNLGTDNLRERLLSRLPQPENLPGYQEETACLLARHEKALFWERILAGTIMCLGGAIWILACCPWVHNLGTAPLGLDERIFFALLGGVMVLSAWSMTLRYQICRSKVDILKEVKQVQLQVFELQASVEKGSRGGA